MRERAQQVVDDGYEPDTVLAIARGGLGVAMGMGYALDVPMVRAEYVWRRTERWIDFPWSSAPPLVDRRGGLAH